jgi:hypothetical protein
MPVAGLEERLRAALARLEALPQDGLLKTFKGAVGEMLGYLEKMKAGEPQKFGLKLNQHVEFLLAEIDKTYPVGGTK